jgi:CDP-diacylglycerol--serine O-phosphatidyltransferase
MLLIPAAVVTLGAGLLMVSNFRFFSLKMVRLTERVPFRYILFVVGLLALFAIYPPYIFFLVFFVYALTGPVGALWRRYRKVPPPPITAS